MSDSPRSENQTLLDGFADHLLKVLLGFIAGIYLTGVAFLSLGFKISPLSFLMGAAAGLLLPRFIPPRDRGWRAEIAVVVLVPVTVAVSNWFFDYSWDGLAIHKEAVAQLLAGWNPYRNGSSSVGVEYFSSVYPKSGWICAAQLSVFLPGIEGGKAINLLGIVAAFLAAWRFLRSRVRPWYFAVAGAGLIALNPVSVYQALTFCNDGLLASLLTVLLFSLAHHVKWPVSVLAWFEIAVSVLLAANLKYTGLVYVGFVLFVAGVVCLCSQPFRTTVRFGVCAVAVMALAVGFCGQSPYMHHLAAGRHLFHPLMGKEKIDIITKEKPTNLEGHNRVVAFVISNFSRSQNVAPPAKTKMRLPFDLRHIDRQWVDIRSGGFGPLFAESLLLAGFIGVALLALREKIFGRAGGLILAASLISGFAHPEAWWARYSPQLFPLAVLAMLAGCRSAKCYLRIASLGGLGLLTLNLLIVSYLSTVTKRGNTALWHRTVAEMRAAAAETGAPIKLDSGVFPILGLQVQQNNIPYVKADLSTSEERRAIPGIWDASWKRGDKNEAPSKLTDP